MRLKDIESKLTENDRFIICRTGLLQGYILILTKLKKTLYFKCHEQFGYKTYEFYSYPSFDGRISIRRGLIINNFSYCSIIIINL